MADFAAELTAEPTAISAMTEQVTAFLGARGVDARAIYHVALVLDELLTNAATHGATGGTPVSVSLRIAPDRVFGEVVDQGFMFDPRAAPVPDLSVGIDEREIGGLGLLLVQSIAEDLTYDRTGDRNRTTFSIRRTPG